MATARANFNSVISADATQFHATMRRVAVTAKTVGARIGRSMANATRAMGRVAASAGKAAVAIGAVGTAVAAAAFTSAVKEMYDLGGSLSDLSSRTGIAVGELAILQRAFRDNGLAADKVGPIINKMQKGITDFGAGLSTQVRAFERLGISYEMIREKSPLQQFQLIQTALAGVSNQSVRTATAMEIFGRAGGELQALFDDAGAVEKATQSLGSAAGILERNAQTFDRISDLMQSATANLKLFVLGVAEVAAPKILAALERFNSIDFADLGVRFVNGLNIENVQELIKATFDLSARFFADAVFKGLAGAMRLFGDTWASYMDKKISEISENLKQNLILAGASLLNPVNLAASIVDKGMKLNNASEQAGEKFADTMLAAAEGEDPFNMNDAIDRLEKVYDKWMTPGGGNGGSGIPWQNPSTTNAPTPSPSKAGMNFFGIPYEQEQKRSRIPLFTETITARQHELESQSLKMSMAATAGFRGLAAGHGMQLERLMGIGPGKNNAFARDRRRLGIGSGLSTGGLGAKRAVGRGKDEAEMKRQIELAKSSEEHLMDIKEKIDKSLSVGQ